jgi:Thiolase C-terminal domain-like
VRRGEAGAFIAEHNTAPGDNLPLNTNGGGLSYMHPACTACMHCRRACARCAASPRPRSPMPDLGLPWCGRHVRRLRHHDHVE